MRQRPSYLLVLITCCVQTGFSQSAAFTYQGRLDNAGAPANGLHDLNFRLFTAASGGSQIGAAICADNVNVADGLFTIQLDFGQQFITATPRFLSIEVRGDTGLDCVNSSGFTLLLPRQALTASPLAIHARSAFALDAADGLPASAVFVDNNGRVGVGTASPTHSVHIANPGPTLALQDTDSTTQQVGYVSYRDSGNVERGWIGYGSAGDPDLTILNARSGGDIVLTSFGGNVGIGTTAPAARLSVDGAVRVDINGVGENFHLHHPNGNLIWNMGVDFTSNPYFSLISHISGDGLAGLWRDSSDGHSIFFADEKNFRAPNPADPTTDIWYCCPEGPEAAMYVRGTARLSAGHAVIELPDHFRNLASEPGMTVQLTPLSAESKGLAVLRKSLAGIEIAELAGGQGAYEFDWRVEAVRKGYEDYQVIRPWMRSDPDESKAWQNRMRWIQEREARNAR